MPRATKIVRIVERVTTHISATKTNAGISNATDTPGPPKSTAPQAEALPIGQAGRRGKSKIVASPDFFLPRNAGEDNLQGKREARHELIRGSAGGRDLLRPHPWRSTVAATWEKP
jgi:hypothetical protein